jgi:aspartate/methionine/tyrosine aminotransferase
MHEIWKNLNLGYTETAGHPMLRQCIADLYQDIDVEKLRVVVPQEGIFLVMHALLERDDHVICTFPGYQSLYEVARSVGCKLDFWQPDETNGWRFDITQLKALLRPETRLVVINFPHNPTGWSPSPEEFIEICRIVESNGAYLLSDEMYRWMEIEPGTTLPSASERYERGLSLGGLSKSFGMPGLRIGWIVSREMEALQKISLLKDYTTICASAPSEILAVVALRNKALIIQQQLDRLRRNFSILVGFFASNKQVFKFNRPIGGSICFPRFLGDQGAREFCEHLVRDTGIMLAPSTAFKYGDRHMRFGFGREYFPEVLGLLAQYLDR